jgi:hypothetical protein
MRTRDGGPNAPASQGWSIRFAIRMRPRPQLTEQVRWHPAQPRSRSQSRAGRKDHVTAARRLPCGAGADVTDSPRGSARDAVRTERRYQHRLRGDGRGSVRSSLRPRLRHASRAALEDADVCTLPPTALILLPADSVRQARHRDVRSGERRADARDAYGRRASGDGRGGVKARRLLWPPRGRR